MFGGLGFEPKTHGTQSEVRLIMATLFSKLDKGRKGYSTSE